MKREKFEEMISQLKYEKNKWLTLPDVSSIMLDSGVEIYPNPKRIKFFIKDEIIYVRYGRLKPYGARINALISIASDYSAFTFARGPLGLQVDDSSFPGTEKFRHPVAGDNIVFSNGNTVYGEAAIKEIRGSINSVIVYTWNPIRIQAGAKASYYDPNVLARSKQDCAHSTLGEGIFMKFESNQKSRKTTFGEYHQEIDISDIAEIKINKK